MDKSNDSGKQRYDLAVIGGGISGLGLAAEAAQSGFEVILIERGALCQATSANSLRIIHGGFRYMQTLNLRRVIRSIRSRDELMRQYPDLVVPIRCVMPLKPSGLKSRLPVSAANFVYNSLHRVLTGRGGGNGILTAEETAGRIPVLRGGAPHGALQWEDAVLQDPAALTARLADSARKYGAKIAEHTAVKNVILQGRDLMLECSNGDQSVQYRAAVVVNAAGPWLDRVSGTVTPPVKHPSHRWSKAFNLVLGRKIEREYAVGAETTAADGSRRLLFLTPRGGASVLGTGYTSFSGDPSSAQVSPEEIAEFLNSFNAVFPAAALSPADVKTVEVGVLPLSRLAENPADLQGSERIYEDGAYLQILSTKYTTFKLQAREVLLRASRHLR